MEHKTSHSDKANGDISAIYDLGDSIFNAEHGELSSKSTPTTIHIEHKVCLVFQCLADAQGDVVTREEIFVQVWPNIIVSDDCLNRCISVLRKIFNTFGHGLSIKTHPKVGFHLIYPKPKLTNEQVNSYDSINKKTYLNHLDKLKTKHHKNFYFLLVLLIFILVLFTYRNVILPQKKSGNPTQLFQPTLNEQRVVILPFQYATLSSANKFTQLESTFRALISNHPEHTSIAKSELTNLTEQQPMVIAQQFSARFIISGQILLENSRDIFEWQIIDAQTGDVIFHKRFNIALNTNETSARMLAAEFIYANALLRFDNDEKLQMKYIINSANYLFYPHNYHINQLPILSMIATAITDIDPDSVLALKTFAKMLSSMIAVNNERNEVYLNLAINTLNKALDIKPYQADLYLLLARMYILKYQWQEAKLILTSGSANLTGQTEFNQLNNFELLRYVGHHSEKLNAHYTNIFNDEPLNALNAIQLANIYIEQKDFEKAMIIANNIMLKLGDWGVAGAEIGPTYLRYGDFDKGRALTKVGYKVLGLSDEYAEVLIQGIITPAYRAKASEFFKQAAENNEFPLTTLQFIYVELGDIDNYFALAFDLAENFQFDPLTILRANTQAIIKHPQFVPLMRKIGLANYWKKHGLPFYCSMSDAVTCY